MSLRQRANVCPAGKQFWKCSIPNFQGCCSVDACANVGCPDAGSTGAGMNPDAIGYTMSASSASQSELIRKIVIIDYKRIADRSDQ